MMNASVIGPELFVLFTAAVFLALTLMRPDPGRDRTAAVALSALGLGVCVAGAGASGSFFHDTYRVDLFSQAFKILLVAGFFLVTVLCEELEGIHERYRTEFYLLLSVCTLSMMLLVSSVHLLTVYVSLELSSYSLYMLVFLRRDRSLGTPAGLRYFLVGATASAVMLFGMALVYAATRATHVSDFVALVPGALDRPWVAVGLMMTLCGFFFKLAVFPFHSWAPEVYEAAANQVTAYIATASKVGAMAVLTRFTALAAGSAYILDALVVLAVVSMTVGNLAAIVQKDFKRLLAYSSVAHAGYVMIGMVAMTPEGYASVIFYAAAVLSMKFTCFLVIVQVAGDGRSPSIADLAGLHRRSPLLALALMMALFGLAGIPPTIGFTGKLLLFVPAVEKGMIALVIIAMVNVLVSLYYYLLVLKAAYLDEPADEPGALALSVPVRILTAALIGFMVVAGFYPNPLVDFARQAAAALL